MRHACILTLALTAAPIWASAQTPTVHLQAAHIGGTATTTTVGLQWTRSLGDVALPQPGQQVDQESRSWLLVGGLAGGYSWTTQRGPNSGLNAAAHAGLMYRTGALVDQVGVVGYLNARPFGAGPALRAKIAVLDVQAGGLWVEGRRGLHWFIGGGVSLQFLCDLFCR